MTQDERIRQQFEKWAGEQPRCIGSARCDGDLVGTNHETDCPMSKVEDSAGRLSTVTPLSAYRAGRDAGLEAAAQQCDGVASVCGCGDEAESAAMGCAKAVRALIGGKG